MRATEVFEGARTDIAAFAAFDQPNINTLVHSQAARLNPAWKKTLTELMAQYGFTLIGAGINGAVFKHKSYPFVLKVYRSDVGYDEWLYFCRGHQRNPHVPKIKGQVVRLNTIFSAVRLEPLIPCSAEIANAFIAPIENALSGVYSDLLAYMGTNPAEGEIAKFLRDWEPATDLSSHNVMMRPNGEVVIVDPIYVEHGTAIDW